MRSLKLLWIVLYTCATAVVVAQNVGIQTVNPDSTLSIQNKVEIGGSQGDILFTDDEGSITFPTTTAPNSPMIHLFNGGTSNANRMVLSHSPAYPTWGLEYQDTDDKFRFLRGGSQVATIDLDNSRVGIGIDTPQTRFHVFATTGAGSLYDMRFEGPNNFFDIYSTAPGSLNGMRFYNDGIFEGGLFYDPGDDHVYLGASASLSNSVLFVDLSGSRKLGLVSNSLPTDHSVAIGGNVHITSGEEASLTDHGYLQAGSTSGNNLILDDNEIAARNNGSASPLFLQPNQGNVIVGSTGSFTEKLFVEAETNVDPLRVRTAGTTRQLIYGNGDYLMFPERMRIRGSFSDDHLVAIGGNVFIQSGQEASLTEHGFLQMGSTTGLNLVMDNNEIMARNNAVEAPLFLQPNQGNVVIGSTSDWPATLHVANETGDAGLRVQIDGATKFIVDSDGAVMISTATQKKPGYELNVNGQIVAEEVLVQNSVNWPDYVFADDYLLAELRDVELFIKEHRHLPNVPSAAQIEEDGINLGEMDKTLLRKIEELTLYMIQQSRDIEQLKAENQLLKQQVEQLQH